MEIKVVQKIDKNYYQEFYTEWLEFRSVFKKWEDKIGILCIVIGIMNYIFSHELFYFAFAFLFFGLFMIYEFYASKKKWMKSRLESNVNNKSFTMIFDDYFVRSNGPFTEVKSKWDYFQKGIETPKGIFLIPENGISIYLQKKSFENQTHIRKIIEKVNENDFET